MQGNGWCRQWEEEKVGEEKVAAEGVMEEGMGEVEAHRKMHAVAGARS